jgi:hypothetical protein
MSSRSERSELFESQPPGKRLAAAPRARLRTFGRALSACSNDDDKAPETATTTSDQVNSAPPAPYAMPQNVATQAAPAAAAGLPPNAFQTPPPTAAQVGAAASDSLVTPVIHTVD